MIIDSHTHGEFSFDSKALLEDFIIEAKKRA
jgi:histidinol phosphatase-like PHP family hydrolase